MPPHFLSFQHSFILTGFPRLVDGFCETFWQRFCPEAPTSRTRGVCLKILVCIKQVPQKDAPLKLNESGTWIREDVSYEVNEPDAYALEEALRQKEKHGGEVVVITSGPARSQQVLREALAKGADRAIHLEDNVFVGLDAFNTARALAAAIKDEQFDLIFTGLQSDDYGYAQTGVILAELLGWPHATIIMQIEKSEGGIRVKRELEAGFFQFVDMPLPAVLTIQSGINKLRYATLIGIKQAKNKPMRKVTMTEVQSAIGENLQKIERMYIPQKTKKTEFLEGQLVKLPRSWWTNCGMKCGCCSYRRKRRASLGWTAEGGCPT